MIAGPMTGEGAMVRLVTHPWNTLQELCQTREVRRLEILTGFIGKGATQALAARGVEARIIVGLASADAALTEAQIEEIAKLREQHQVRWLRGLHAKLYLLDRRIVVVGSANFTKAGFENLDEIGIATDHPDVIACAVEEFDARFREAQDLEPSRLAVLPSVAPALDGHVDEAPEVGLGLAWTDRASGFSAHAARSSVGAPPFGDPASAAGAIMFVNIAEGPHRCWADCRRYGFLSAGQGPRWSERLRGLEVGDRVYAYLEGAGYVGAGTVTGTPRMASEHVVVSEGRALFDLELSQRGIQENAGDPAYGEWVVPVRWHVTLDPIEARCRKHFRRGYAACRIRSPEAIAALEAACGPPEALRSP